MSQVALKDMVPGQVYWIASKDQGGATIYSEDGWVPVPTKTNRPRLKSCHDMFLFVEAIKLGPDEGFATPKSKYLIRILGPQGPGWLRLWDSEVNDVFWSTGSPS